MGVVGGSLVSSLESRGTRDSPDLRRQVSRHVYTRMCAYTCVCLCRGRVYVRVCTYVFMEYVCVCVHLCVRTHMYVSGGG